MNDDEISTASLIDDALQCSAEDAFPDGALLIRWVAVCEWVTTDDKWHLTVVTPDNMPSWQAKALLREPLSGDFIDNSYGCDYEDEE